MSGHDTPPRPDVPNADGGDLIDLEELGDDVLIADDSVTCENCAHSDVCAFYQGFTLMLSEGNQNVPGDLESAPFDAERLAAICEAFERDD